MAFVGVSIKAGVKRGWLLAGLQGEYRVDALLSFLIFSFPPFLSSSLPLSYHHVMLHLFFFSR